MMIDIDFPDSTAVRWGLGRDQVKQDANMSENGRTLSRSGSIELIDNSKAPGGRSW